MKKDEEESSTEPKESSPPTEKKEDKDDKKEASAETSGKKEKTDPDANLPRISQPSVVDVSFDHFVHVMLLFFVVILS